METIKVYKLFRYDEHLFSLFIDSTIVLPTGQWLTARAPSDEVMKMLTSTYSLIDSTGHIISKREQKPVSSMITTASLLQMRWVMRSARGRYYDLGLSSDGRVIPFAHRPGWHSCKEPILTGVNMNGKVWAECFIPASGYDIVRRNINGMTSKSHPVEWFISKKIYINKIL